MATGSGRYLDFGGLFNIWQKLRTTFTGEGGFSIGTRADGYLDGSLHPPLGIPAGRGAPGTHLLGLPNGNFEDGLSGWTPTTSGTGAVAIDGTAGNQVTGVNSAKLVTGAAADKAQVASGLFPCGARIPVSVFAMAKSLGAAGRLVVSVAWFDRAKTALTTTPNTVLYSATVGPSFAEYGGSIVPPAGAAYGQASVSLDTAADTAWVDEVVVNREDVFDFDLRNFMGVGDGATDDTVALQTALGFFSRAGGGTLCVRALHYLNPAAATTIVVPANVELRFGPAGRLKLGAKATLSVVGRINAGPTWIFDTTTVAGGIVTTSGDCRTTEVWPEWWSAAPVTGVVAPSAAPGSNCAPSIQAAVNFAAVTGCRLLCRALFYNCASGIVIPTNIDIVGMDGGSSSPYGLRTTWDFSSAPSGAIGLTWGTASGVIERGSIRNLSIGRATTATAGSGSYGLYLIAALYGDFENLGIYGFDENLFITNSSANPCIRNRFDRCLFGIHATRNIHIVSQTGTTFNGCDIQNAATNETVLIAAPGTGVAVTQDTLKFRDCFFGTIRSAYTRYHVVILGGLWYSFDHCDFETALNGAIYMSMTGAQDQMLPVVTADDCWFDDVGTPIASGGYINSFRVTNCPRIIAEPAGTTTSGGVTTNTPGGGQCIFAADSQSTSRTVDITISHNNMQSLRSDGNCIVLGNVIGAGVHNNRCYQGPNAMGNSPIKITNGSGNVVTGNRLHSSAVISDGGTGDVIADNVNF